MIRCFLELKKLYSSVLHLGIQLSLFMQILKCAHQKFNARDAHQHTGEFQQIR